MRALLGLAALLALCWLMADKQQLAEDRRKVTRWARPLFWVVLAFAIWAFLIYPYTHGDGHPFN